MTIADLVSCIPLFGDALGLSYVSSSGLLVEIAGGPVSHRLDRELRPSCAIEWSALLATPRGDFVWIEGNGPENDALGGECDHRIGGRLAPLFVGVLEGVAVIGEFEQPGPLIGLVPRQSDDKTGRASSCVAPPRRRGRPEVARRE